MARSRKVMFQGETYADPEAARDAVDELLKKAAELDEGSSERDDVIRHAAGLEDAARNVLGKEPAGEPPSEAAVADGPTGATSAAEADRPGEPEGARDDPPEGWQTCPLCAGGGITPTALHQDPNTATCSDCGGLGIVYTGALVDD